MIDDNHWHQSLFPSPLTTLRRQSNQYNYKSGQHLRDELWSMVRRNRIHWCKKYQLKDIDRPFNPTLVRSYQTSKSFEDEEEVSSGVDNARLVCGRKWGLHESRRRRPRSDEPWLMVRRLVYIVSKNLLKEIYRPLFNRTLVRWLTQGRHHLRPLATLQRYVSWRFLTIQSGLHVRSCTWTGTCVFKFPMPVTDAGVDVGGADWDVNSDGAGVELAAVSPAELSIRWLISDG